MRALVGCLALGVGLALGPAAYASGGATPGASAGHGAATAGDHDLAPAHAEPAADGHGPTADGHGASPTGDHGPAAAGHGEAVAGDHGAAAGDHGASPEPGDHGARSAPGGHGASPAPGGHGASPAGDGHGGAPPDPASTTPLPPPPPPPLAPRFADGPARTVVVLDASMNMRLRDPERLAHAAVLLLVALQRPGDELALVAYAEQAEVLLPPTPVDESLLPRVRELLAALPNRGQGARAAAGVRHASRALLEGATNTHQRRIILLTAGGEDVLEGHAAEAALERTRTLTLLPEQLRSMGATLSTVGFTRSADRPLLEAIAARTGGAHRFVLRAESMGLALAELVADSGARTQLPLTDDGRSFRVDGAVQQLVVVFDRSAGPVALEGPDGARWSPEQLSDTVLWGAEATLGWVRVRDPSPGRWSVLQAPDALPPEIWAERSRLRLGLRLDERDATLDHHPRLGVFVAPSGGASLPAELAGFAIITDPEGRRSQVPMERVGRGALELVVLPSRAGHHHLEVHAELDDHRRVLTVDLGIAPSCLEHEVRPVEHGLVIAARTSTACASAGALVASLVDRGTGERVALTAEHDDPWQTAQVMASLERARSLTLEATLEVRGEVLSASRGPFELAPWAHVASTSPWYLGLLWRLGVLNVPVVLALGGLWLRRRRRAMADAVADGADPTITDSTTPALTHPGVSASEPHGHRTPTHPPKAEAHA